MPLITIFFLNQINETKILTTCRKDYLIQILDSNGLLVFINDFEVIYISDLLLHVYIIFITRAIKL